MFEQFKQWLDNWANGNLSEPDNDMLREALIGFGARPENLNEGTLPSLSKYSNAGRAAAMRAIWGHRFDAFKLDVNIWIKEYEERTGKLLPALAQSGKKSSGMIQIFGEITALAFGGTSFAEIYPFLIARKVNGDLWQADMKEKRIRLVTPNALKEGPKLVSSIPPGFEEFLYAEMSAWIGIPWMDSGSSTDVEE